MRSVFSRAIMDAARRDPRFLLLSGDHGYALFDDFRAEFPDKFINAGIAEQNMVGVAAGLAKAGFHPMVYGLSAFVPVRVLEQIKLDVCYENLPVVFIGDGAGLVYSSLGTSHQSTEDIAILRAIPGIQILSPCDRFEMEYAMRHALNFTGPTYLRMGKSDVGDVHTEVPAAPMGDLLVAAHGAQNHTVFIATGAMVKIAVLVAERMGGAAVWSAPSIKPINQSQVEAIARAAQHVVVLEEHVVAGGLGGLIAELVGEVSEAKARVIRMGVQDKFSVRCGSYSYLLREHGLDVESLTAQLTVRLAV